MIPHNTLLDRLRDLLAADSTTLAPAALGTKLHLAKAPFTPSPTLALASLTEADFAGYAALVAGVGTQQTFFDPVTGLRVIQILEPAGGWTFEATGAPVPVQVISGFYLTDNGTTVLYGAQLLPTPVTISSIGDAVVVGTVRFSMPATALG